MTLFESHSQAGQDRFVYEVLGKPFSGLFLDVGMGDPIQDNNTYALEQLGWRGLLIDKVKRDTLRRQSRFIKADATLIDWMTVLDGVTLFDYLSLDVDEATLPTLVRMPLSTVRFRVITIEHDKYRLGPVPQWGMQKLLFGWNYMLVAEDVKANGLEFEDWWIDPANTSSRSFDRFRSRGRDGRELSLL